MLRSFPLLLVAVLVYTAFATGFAGASHHDAQEMLSAPVASFGMPSAERWTITTGDLLILLSLVLLFAEIVKATRTTTRQIINHGLSMLTFVFALVEFITLKGFATSTFFIILTITLIDVVAGYTISIVAAEHDLGLGRSGTD